MLTMAIWITLRVLIALVAIGVLYKLPIERKRTFLTATAATLAFVVIGYLLLAALGGHSMGYSAIAFAPFVSGFLFIFLYRGLDRPTDGSEPVLPSFARLAIILPTILVGLELALLFVLFLEGTICLIMAAPFLWVFTLAGSMLGYGALKALRLRPKRHVMVCVLVLGLSPVAVQPAENRWLADDLQTHVTTPIVINASPQRIFAYIQAFPPIANNQPPRHLSEWMFPLGLPAPERSTIDCHHAGCVRHCIFNQHTHFEERVKVYQPGRELTFNVVSVVGPQSPITGVDVHVMPGGIYFDNHQGQFLLWELAPGRTLVLGTTWYRLHSSLNWYAKPWADLMLHTIHRRVLEHIKQLAEAENTTTGKPANP